ncbi:surface glycoprotein Tc-85/20 [Trypanosoma cruzi]|nr:surface glycoprotein Tc-85/20 [Trypanosoma cruzi]
MTKRRFLHDHLFDGRRQQLSAFKGILTADCIELLIAEWEQGQLPVITHCYGSRYCRVHESRDKGTMRVEVPGAIAAVWANSQSVLWENSLRVGAIVTATVGGKSVML